MKKRIFTTIFLLVFVFASLNAFAEEAVSNEAQEEQTITVTDLKIAETIEDREAVEFSQDITADIEKVYCWMKVEGATAENPVVLKHQWFWGEKMIAEVELNVAGSPWRTWSSKRMWKGWTGEWTVKVVDEEGNVLKETTFTVQASEEVEEPEEAEVPKTEETEETEE